MKRDDVFGNGLSGHVDAGALLEVALPAEHFDVLGAVGAAERDRDDVVEVQRLARAAMPAAATVASPNEAPGVGRDSQSETPMSI